MQSIVSVQKAFFFASGVKRRAKNGPTLSCSKTTLQHLLQQQLHYNKQRRDCS